MPEQKQWRVTVTPSSPVDEELAAHLDGAFKPGVALWEYAKIGYMVATRQLTGQAGQSDAPSSPIANNNPESRDRFQSAVMNFDDED